MQEIIKVAVERKAIIKVTFVCKSMIDSVYV